MTPVTFDDTNGSFAVEMADGANTNMEFDRSGTFEVTDELATYLVSAACPRAAAFTLGTRVPVDYTGQINIGHLYISVGIGRYGYKSPFTTQDPFGVLQGDGNMDHGVQLGALDAVDDSGRVRLITSGLLSATTLNLTYENGGPVGPLVLTQDPANPTWYEVVDTTLADFMKANVRKGLTFTIQG